MNIDLLNLIGSYLGDARYQVVFQFTPITRQLSKVMFSVPRKNLPKHVFKDFPNRTIRRRYFGSSVIQVFWERDDWVFYWSNESISIIIGSSCRISSLQALSKASRNVTLHPRTNPWERNFSMEVLISSSITHPTRSLSSSTNDSTSSDEIVTLTHIY